MGLLHKEHDRNAISYTHRTVHYGRFCGLIGTMITHYDLFAGIGGFSYALDTVFNEEKIKHIFCEWEQFPTAVLKKHWPDSVYYGDIQELIKELECQNQEYAQNVEKKGTSHHQKQTVNTVEDIVDHAKDYTTSSGEKQTTKEQKQAQENGCVKNEQKFLKHTETNVPVVEKIHQSSLPSTTSKTMGQRKEKNSAPNGGMLQLKETSQTIINSCATTAIWPNQSTKYAHTKEKNKNGDIADLVTDTDSQRREGKRKQDEGRHGLFGGKVPNQGQEMVILTGGFPCQPFSHAGRRKGTSDDRYKWPEMFAVIRNVRPDWVIAENVRGLASWNDGMVLETVCADLESEGYEVRPYIIPAASVGAPHRRERVWIVANRRCELREQRYSKSMETKTTIRTFSPKTNQRDSEHLWAKDWREVALATCHDGVDDGLPRKLDGATYRNKPTDCISAAQHRKDRLKACGNAIVPQVAMEIFRAIKQTV